MAKRKQQWQIGDVFTVETLDGRYVIGQIVGQEKDILNSVSIAFYDLRYDGDELESENIDLDPKKIFSLVFSTRDLLDSGKWKVIGNQSVPISDNERPYEQLRESGFIGANVVGSGNLEEFLNAFYALLPWDDWYDPNYLDTLLSSPEKKPSNLIYKSG